MKSVRQASRLCSLAGECLVDPLINEVLPVELKTVKALDHAHMPPGA